MPPAPETPFAIELTKVSVAYRLPVEAVGTLKEHAIRALKGRLSENGFFALRDVDLAVRRGERVAIIGPNGAGKSTLFRVLSRVKRPSSGRVVVRGSVAPILELGLGLHGELTGRENVILQGALLGFPRSRMRERMDAIAGFAELEGFLDAPMRTYSTGMASRLAFAVATDATPDVLLVDEALSVGDERFQRKCFERMRSFWNEGRTFLLVSHLLGDVRASCDRAVWLSEGRVVRDGPAESVVAEYQEWCARSAGASPDVAG